MREAHAAERNTLFVVGSYHIGKERAFFGAARAMGFKIWCHAAKQRVSIDTDNSHAILCSCTGWSAVSLASCMPFQLDTDVAWVKLHNCAQGGIPSAKTQMLECVACYTLLWLSSSESSFCFACQAAMHTHGMIASGSSSSDVPTISSSIILLCCWPARSQSCSCAL